MEQRSYKVAANGKISLWSGKTRLASPWLEEFPTLAERRALRAQLDPILVKAAWLVFGRRCLPADLNTLLEQKKVVHQVMADSPRLLGPIYHAVCDGDLKPTPTHSLVKRFKALLRREGFVPRQRDWRGCYIDAGRHKVTDVSKFWQGKEREEALTEGGWRYLCNLPVSQLRAYFTDFYDVEVLKALNLLSVLDVRGLPSPALGLALALSRYRDLDGEAQKALLLALRETVVLDPRTLDRQADLVTDWVRGEKPAIQPGTAWSTLVERAVSFALMQAELDRQELQDLSWPTVVDPFVTSDGLVVRALCNGAELLDEGHAMSNCLRSMKHYAHDAVRGKSQVFSISGVAGRATVEFCRASEAGAWTLRQAEEAGNRPVTVPALKRAVTQLTQKMQEAA